MTELNFNQKLAQKLLMENLVYEYQGFVNAYDDGEMTKEELQDELDIEKAKETIDHILNEFYKDGYISSPMRNNIVEAKHLKFSGKEVLEKIKLHASAMALFKFYEYMKKD